MQSRPEPFSKIPPPAPQTWALRAKLLGGASPEIIIGDWRSRLPIGS